MMAYELLPHLKYLTLTSNGEGGIEWIGTQKNWELVNKIMKEYEQN